MATISMGSVAAVVVAWVATGSHGPPLIWKVPCHWVVTETVTPS